MTFFEGLVRCLNPVDVEIPTYKYNCCQCGRYEPKLDDAIRNKDGSLDGATCPCGSIEFVGNYE